MVMCDSVEQLKGKLGLRFATPGSGVNIEIIKHCSEQRFTLGVA